MWEPIQSSVPLLVARLGVLLLVLLPQPHQGYPLATQLSLDRRPAADAPGP
jgi:hypothetical protein